jgi:N-acetylneuraminic acid mutarotase
LLSGNHDIVFARIEDRLYTAGGKTYFGWPASDWTNLDHVWSYSLSQGTWSIEAPMLEPGKSYSGIAALGDEVWIIGGYFIEGNQTVATSTVEIYEPRSRRFRPGPPLDEPRGQVVALTLNDRLFAIGGGIKKMVSIAIDETAWQSEPAPPGPVAQASGCVLGGKLYVASGAGSQCPGLFVYDPQQHSWSEVRHPSDTAPNAPLCAAHDGQVWVMGGVGNGGARVATHVYSPESSQWRKGPDLPLPVSWGAAADVNGRLLIAGGAYQEPRAKDYHNSDRAFLLREP